VAISNWRCQYIIDIEFDIRTILTIVGQREAVRRFNAQYDRTGTAPRLGWDETCFYSFSSQKMQDEIAHLVFSDRCEEC